MDELVKDLLEISEYQHNKLETLVEICESCLVHTLHEDIDFNRIEAVHRKVKEYLNQSEREKVVS